jgi:hypothetical protein
MVSASDWISFIGIMAKQSLACLERGEKPLFEPEGIKAHRAGAALSARSGGGSRGCLGDCGGNGDDFLSGGLLDCGLTVRWVGFLRMGRMPDATSKTIARLGTGHHTRRRVCSPEDNFAGLMWNHLLGEPSICLV